MRERRQPGRRPARPALLAVAPVMAVAAAALAGCGGADEPDPAALRDARKADAQYGTPWDPAGAGGEASAEAGAQAAAAEASPDRTGGRSAPEPVEVREGLASYYSDSLAGNTTANGETYDPAELTAASRDLPFGTVVRVVRRDNGKSVRVRINDRGPFGDERRILDLSRAAAERLGMIQAGVVPIRAEILSR